VGAPCVFRMCYRIFLGLGVLSRKLLSMFGLIPPQGNILAWTISKRRCCSGVRSFGFGCDRTTEGGGDLSSTIAPAYLLIFVGIRESPT